MTKIIEILVKNAREPEGWREEYTIHETDHEAWARKTIQAYNASLRTGEIPRELVSVKVLKDSKSSQKFEDHEWEKTNLITQRQRGMIFDTFTCTKCQITGKRFGLSHNIKRDAEFKAKKYEYCMG